MPACASVRCSTPARSRRGRTAAGSSRRLGGRFVVAAHHWGFASDRRYCATSSLAERPALPPLRGRPRETLSTVDGLVCDQRARPRPQRLRHGGAAHPAARRCRRAAAGTARPCTARSVNTCARAAAASRACRSHRTAACATCAPRAWPRALLCTAPPLSQPQATECHRHGVAGAGAPPPRGHGGGLCCSAELPGPAPPLTLRLRLRTSAGSVAVAVSLAASPTRSAAHATQCAPNGSAARQPEHLEALRCAAAARRLPRTQSLPIHFAHSGFEDGAAGGADGDVGGNGGTQGIDPGGSGGIPGGGDDDDVGSSASALAGRALGCRCGDHFCLPPRRPPRRPSVYKTKMHQLPPRLFVGGLHRLGHHHAAARRLPRTPQRSGRLVAARVTF